MRVPADGEGRMALGVGRSRERQLQHHAEAIGQEHWHQAQCRAMAICGGIVGGWERGGIEDNWRLGERAIII